MLSSEGLNLGLCGWTSAFYQIRLPDSLCKHNLPITSFSRMLQETKNFLLRLHKLCQLSLTTDCQEILKVEKFNTFTKTIWTNLLSHKGHGLPMSCDYIILLFFICKSHIYGFIASVCLMEKWYHLLLGLETIYKSFGLSTAWGEPWHFCAL